VTLSSVATGCPLPGGGFGRPGLLLAQTETDAVAGGSGIDPHALTLLTCGAYRKNPAEVECRTWTLACGSPSGSSFRVAAKIEAPIPDLFAPFFSA